MCAGASAQEFAPSWNVALKGGVAQTTGEATFSKLISPTAEISLGYQFTPVFGLRGNVGGWMAKGAVTPAAGTQVYSYNYVQGSIDAVFDLCNMFEVNEGRIVNPYFGVGIGEAYAFNNGEAQGIHSKYPTAVFGKLWDKGLWTPAGRGFLGIDFRVSPVVSIVAEVGTNVMSDYFNSKDGGAKSVLDYQNTAMLGLKFTFGKKKVAAPAPVVVPCEPTIQYVDKVVEVEKVVEKIVEVEAPAPTEIAKNIYFPINKWVISAEENAKIIELASFMNQNPDSKCTITGYADKATGTAKRNMFLSEQRAQAVTAKLASYGIAKDRITYSYKGDTENPFATPEENRVSVCVAK